VKNVRRVRKYGWLVLVASTVLVAACTPNAPGEPADDEVTSSENPFIGTDWDLVEYGDQMPLPGSTATIAFTEDGINGSTGCNNYFGSYTLDGSALTIGALGSTEMWCEGIMEQETTLLQMLQASESVTLDGKTLTIHTAQGDIVFTSKEDLVLEGTNWVLNAIVQDQSVVSNRIDEEITVLLEEGKMTGSAGCNQYFTDYEIDGNGLMLGMISATEMYCDEEINQRENEYLTALAEVAGFEIERETLTLTDAEGNHLITFRAQTSSQ
jgi:heat shock protein HslJ